MDAVESTKEEAVAPEVAGHPFPESADVAAAASSTPAAPDLDQLLAEFDQDIAAQPKPEQQQRDQQGVDLLDQILNEPAQQQPSNGEVEARAKELYEQAERERRFWQDHDEAFNRVIAQDERALAYFGGLGANEVRNWMMLRAYDDPQFRNAWFNQKQDPRSWMVAHTLALRELRRELEHREALVAGREVAEDRALVAASMRGSGAKMNVAEPPPNLGQMSENEFRSYKAQFGF
jgi:hypothetical protein